MLMQQAPPEYELKDFRDRLMALIRDLGVVSVHEFHVWRLAGSRIVASIHIVCNDLSNFMETATSIREFFHSENIHSVTIQPELVSPKQQVPQPDLDGPCIQKDPPSTESDAFCRLQCSPDLKCQLVTCCPAPRPLPPHSS